MNEDTILYTEMPGKLKIASLTNKSIIDVSNVPEVAYSSQEVFRGYFRSDFDSNNKIYISYSAKR